MPPSLGDESVRFLARQLADVLFDAGFATVVPLHSYADLEAALLRGDAHAAWGPPVVCGRIERAGGRVALQSQRDGAATYRAALIARVNSGYRSIDHLRASSVPVRAAWVDPWAAAGYLLPRHHLRAAGIDPDTLFAEQRFLGSYDACVKAMLDFDADVTAGFTGPRGHAHVELAGARARELTVVAETDECPADGIVLSSCLDERAANQLTAALLAVVADAAAMRVLGNALDVDALVAAPAGLYGALPWLDDLGVPSAPHGPR